MRFLVSEKPFELPLAAGLIRYERDGVKTGTVEHWRLTKVPTGDHILRVDLDARGADGDSYLYHLITNPEGQIERLIYRVLLKDLSAMAGTVLFGDGVMTNSRSWREEQMAEELVESAETNFYFPSTIGLTLALRHPQKLMGVTLNMHDDSAEKFYTLKEHAITINKLEPETIQVGRRKITGQTCKIAWDGGWRTLTVDADGWPLRMCRDDGLCAQETRTMRYNYDY